ncbi:hypothetical protein NPS63_06080 [Escherichia coli]|nr:hypothetical protein [Escherichia coli]
MSVSCWEFTAG